jgi:hypothetical protein
MKPQYKNISQMKSYREQVKKEKDNFNNLCKELQTSWTKMGLKGDPFSYGRIKEARMSFELNHILADKYAGCDAFDENGEYEYKSTIGKDINGTYNGISVQPTWEEQKEYFKNEKILKYKNHYFCRFKCEKVEEIYEMDSDKVLSILEPKLKKDFYNKKSGKYKDPRLGVTLSKDEIVKYGTKIK